MEETSDNTGIFENVFLGGLTFFVKEVFQAQSATLSSVLADPKRGFGRNGVLVFWYNLSSVQYFKNFFRMKA